MGALLISSEPALSLEDAPKPLARPDELGGARVVPPKDGHPSEYLTSQEEVDPFAGVFALGVFLGVSLLLFFAQLIGVPKLSAGPPSVEVTVVSVAPQARAIPPQPVQTPPPPPVPLRAREASPLGKSADSATAPVDSPLKNAPPASGNPTPPSENRLLNEQPTPRGSPTPEPNASTAAAPSSDLLRLAPTDPANQTARSAIIDTRPAGVREVANAPAAPGPPVVGSARAAGEGVLVTASRISGVMPTYPPAARARGEEGTVLLRIQVGIDGRIERVDILRSSGSQVLDATARNGVRQWQFSPAMRANGPVRSTVEVPITFKMVD
jgi:protein TonB